MRGFSAARATGPGALGGAFGLVGAARPVGWFPFAVAGRDS